MPTDKKNCPKIPGNIFQRFIAWIWYGGFMSLYLGPVSAIREARHKIKKVDYSLLPPKTEEIAVLTGATRGIGAAVLKKLLQLDFTVIIGARKVEAGQKAVDKIREEAISTGKVVCFPLDLKSLKSVKAFAENVLEETNRIDVLINNAGIMFEPWEVTEDNVEVQFHVNYLSHYLLTQLLLPTLKETGNIRQTRARFVNVSSIAHYASYGSNIKNAPYPKVYSSRKAYYDSKLCEVLSTISLNTLLHAEGSKVNVYAVHPGIIATDLYDSMGCSGKCIKSFGSSLRSIDEGAEEIMFAAISPELENDGGSYIQNSRKKRPLKDAEKEKYQKILWNVTHDCLKNYLTDDE